MAERSADRASYFPSIEKKHGLPMAFWFDQMREIKDLKYPEQIAYLRENHGFSQAHANALVLYSKGNTTSRRFDTLDDYLAPHDEAKQAKAREIFAAISKKYPKSTIVIAWNQPMVKIGDDYVFGLSMQSKYMLVAPWGEGVLDQFRPRLEGFEVNKKTIKVPFDWKVDKKLLCDMVAARLEGIAT
jgi:uncharacterized protein YdhG (YjbR/CyaY superfamily)